MFPIERTGVNDVVDMAVRLGMRQLLTQQVPRTGGRNYAEVIKARTTDLMQASMKLGEAMYKASQGGEDGGGGQGGGDAPKDDVIDADFQEVDEGDKKKRA